MSAMSPQSRYSIVSGSNWSRERDSKPDYIIPCQGATESHNLNQSILYVDAEVWDYTQS